MLACGGREAMVMAPRPPCDSAVMPCFHGYSGGLVARAAENTVLWKGMTTSLGQYAPVFLPGEPPPDREAWQATVHRVTKSCTQPKRTHVHRRKSFFACGSSAPVKAEHEVGTAAWLVGTLAAPSVQGHGLPQLQELWPCQSLF